MPTLLTSALSLPPATRAFTAALVAFSSLFFLLRLSLAPTDLKAIFNASSDVGVAFPWLVLVPGNVLWAPWTLLTAGFVETNLIEFLISLFTLPLAGRYLERVWGARELLKFVAAVVVVSNGVAVVVNALESFVLGDPALFMYGMSYHGLEALQVAFLVAFTQLIPEHQVQIFGGMAKMRVKSLPMLYVTFSNIVCVFGYQSPYILIQFGWLVSWLYLRFVKQNEGTEFRGDRSETFAFQSWFPPFIQKYVARLSSLVFNLAIKLHVLQPWSDIESAGSVASYQAIPGGAGARAEAERRRAMALEALDRRMATKPIPSTPPPGSAPAPASATPSRTATVASVSGVAVGDDPSTSTGSPAPGADSVADQA
ncbi:hypothetical protein JCM21900_005796 [Sporobolomyces salmonicolor]